MTIALSHHWVNSCITGRAAFIYIIEPFVEKPFDFYVSVRIMVYLYEN